MLQFMRVGFIFIFYLFLSLCYLYSFFNCIIFALPKLYILFFHKRLHWKDLTLRLKCRNYHVLDTLCTSLLEIEGATADKKGRERLYFSPLLWLQISTAKWPSQLFQM